MEVIHFVTIISWSIGLIWGLIIWLRVPSYSRSESIAPSISVLIPVRNEMENLPVLLADLADQTVTPTEVWILDDHSTDGTREWFTTHQFDFPFPLGYWSSDRPEGSTWSPKKYAFTQMVPRLTTEWVLTLDGDCRVNPKWLQSMSGAMSNAYFVAGPISFIPRPSLFSKSQVVELASLQFTAAISIFSGNPTMCSAANMGFRRALFPGYSDNLSVASGDDEFLMHAYHTLFPGKVVWVKSPDALVLTDSQPTFSSFYHQRIRWASKWNRYQNWVPTALAIWVFGVNLLTISCLVLGDFTPLLIRWCIEFLVISTYLRYFKQTKIIWLIPFVQLVYPFYVVIFGLLAQRKSSYSWKGRTWES